MDSILLADDDPGYRRMLEAILAGEGYAVETAASVREAKAAGERRNFHLVLSGLAFPDGDGIEVLRWFAEISPETPVIGIVPAGDASTAVEALKLGASGCIGKPLGSTEELTWLVRRTLDQTLVAAERHILREREDLRFNCNSIIARDPAMAAVLELAGQAAAGSGPVLITGESGAGKEILARSIHAASERAGRAFVVVDCAGQPAAAVESELFGHDKGVFTGSAARYAGRLERAHPGTLFLDEVGALDAGAQARLMRFLEEKTFERPASTRQITVDTRIIAASSRDLEVLVAGGSFRGDLYRLLAAVHLAVPPLRQRRADIPMLARIFLARAARELHRGEVLLTSGAENALQLYEWPGNVRELANLMEHVAMFPVTRVDARDLPLGNPAGREKPLLWKDIERQAIEEALRMNGANRTRAARQLGISLRTLQYRLKEWGVRRV